MFEKTVTDTHDVKTVVHADETISFGPERGRVYLHSPNAGVRYNPSLTPSQARALAKALKQAANVAEGKPAKAPRKDAPPQGVISGSGIMFRRDPNGTYSTSGCIRSTCAYPRKHFDRSLSALLADGGRVMR